MFIDIAKIKVKAGDGGVVVKPQKNEDNEITWEDEKDTLAWLNFTSDDDAKKFFPKMTTKWDDQEYAEYFADQDAYLFDFIGNPQIASTSRASLRLRIPFLNEDGDLSVDEDSIVVYQVVDGALVDITVKGRIHETDDGDWVFELKTASSAPTSSRRSRRPLGKRPRPPRRRRRKPPRKRRPQKSGSDGLAFFPAR